MRCHSLPPFGDWASSPHSRLTRASFVAGSAGSSNPYADTKSQKAFEKGLIEKTAKQTGDIILYDNRIVLYKLESDVMIYLVGAADENEVLLYNTLLAIRDSLHLLFKYEITAALRALRARKVARETES